jgi:hypothetical protein
MMERWHKAIIVIVSTLILILPISRYAMSSDKQDNTLQYRVEYVTPENSKLKLNEEALRELNQAASVMTTVKVSIEGYIPSGVEIRTQVSPLIFTANIPREVLDCLEDDPNVVSIEPVYKLRSY